MSATPREGDGRVRVVVATTVLLTFISFWRAAAIVLNDLGSSAFYVGGIAEQAMGKAAPWFILGVMCFSYTVRAVYIESSAMFVRGGVYRVVKEAMGGTLESFYYAFGDVDCFVIVDVPNSVTAVALTLTINASFDGGNIRVVAIEGDRVDLEIVKDKDSDFYQWFYFRVGGAKGRTLTFRILNGADSAFPDGWPNYQVRASTDRQEWRMTPTTYADGVIEWQWTGESDLAWFAYFAPYTMEMHQRLVARTAAQPGVTHRELGLSLEALQSQREAEGQAREQAIEIRLMERRAGRSAPAADAG